VFVQTGLLPAMCSTQWPHEENVGILELFLVELKHINNVKDWWWWWWIWLSFAKFQKVDHLLFISKSSLVHLILVNLVNFSRDGQHGSC
jgi:hypothetical protein